MHPLEKEASEFAREAHGSIDHRRKYTNDPYIVHPAEVADIVRTVDSTPEVLAACWLHDTVEDVPNVTVESIRERFGPIVGEYVEWLTDKPADDRKLARADRKAEDRLRLWQAPAAVHNIKLADLLSNTKSIVEHDAKFGKLYVREKALLLCVLTKGHPTLLGRAFASLINAADQLRIDIFDRDPRR